MVGKPRKRVNVPEVIGRLEEELSMRMAVLESETRRNETAKIHCTLLNALALGRTSLSRLIAAQQEEAAAAAAAAAEHQHDAPQPSAAPPPHSQPQQQQPQQQQQQQHQSQQQQQRQQRRAAGRAGPSLTPGSWAGAPGAAPPPGAAEQSGVGLVHEGPGGLDAMLVSLDTVASELRSLMGVERPACVRAEGGGAAAGPSGSSSGSGGGAGFERSGELQLSEWLRRIVDVSTRPMERDEFVAYWRDGISSLALRLHQYQRGATHLAPDIEELLCGMNTKLGGAFLSNAWMVRLFTEDLETGAVGEPPHEVATRWAEALALSRRQADALALLDAWWRRQTTEQMGERSAMAGHALAAPRDLEVQEAVLDGLARVQSSWLVLSVATLVTITGGLLTMEQNAEIFIQAWPYIPTLLAFLSACSSVAHGRLPGPQ